MSGSSPRIEIASVRDDPRAVGRALMTDHNLSARVWATAAVVAAPVAPLFGVGWWLPVHLAMVGAATQAIVGGQLMFSATLGLARGPGRRSTLTQLALLNIAAILVIGGRIWTASDALLIGASIFIVTISWVTSQVHRMWRRSVNRRFSVTGTFYLLAGISFIVGASVGGALGAGAFTDGSTYIEHRNVHMIMNVFGWAGLTIAGTLITLLPTVLHVRAPKIGPVRPVPWVMFVGLGVMSFGTTFGVPAVAAGGMAAYSIGLLLLMRYVRSVLSTPRRRKIPTAALHLMAGLVWAVATSMATVWSLDSADASLTRDVVVVGGAGAFVFQVLLGAWSFLLPSTSPPVPDRRRRELVAMDVAGRYQVLAYNIGLALTLVGLRSEIPVALPGIALSWSAAAFALGKSWFFPALARWRSVRVASEERWRPVSGPEA